MIEILKVVVIDGVEQLVTELVETEQVQFRVYYDDNGTILFYTCDKPEGNYLIIDNATFAEKRFDLRVVDGKLVRLVPGMMISKYKPSTKGKICAADDISIVVDSDQVLTQKWELITNELR